MRIIQLTDLHIGELGEDTFNVDVRTNFLNVLERTVALSPDFVVLTGDLNYRHSNPEVYEWIFDQMTSRQLPFVALPGNHDDSQELRKALPLDDTDSNGDEVYFAQNWAPFRVLFLDTARGSCSARQWQWLAAQIQESDQPMLIFMHHPPVHAGVPFMDQRYAFKEPDRFVSTVRAARHPLHVFCGHYHVERSIFQENMQVHITPSTFFNLDDQSNEFAVANEQIGFRIIEWHDPHLRTYVHYFPAQKLS